MKHTFARLCGASLVGIFALLHGGLVAAQGACSSQPGRYVANGAEVLDTRTKLIWQRCVVGASWTGTTCSATTRVFTHEQALAYARDNAGTVGWRLPDVKELSGSFMDRGCASPAVDTVAFPNPGTRLWASTPRAETPSNAWYFDLTNAWLDQAARGGTLAIRLVRSSP